MEALGSSIVGLRFLIHGERRNPRRLYQTSLEKLLLDRFS